MSLFRPARYTSNGLRPTGFSRYMSVLENNLKKFMIVNLITLLGFLPFAVGVALSILSTSVLVLLLACILGGCLAGPCLSCLIDCLYRGLREAPGKCLENYRRAWKQNWKTSLIPGIIFCLLIGFELFMLALFVWSSRFPGWGTIALYLFGMVLMTMFFTVFWPMITLMDLTAIAALRNCILFLMTYFWRTLLLSLLQLLYWIFIGALLPWSLFLMPLIGFWFILYTVSFFLYETFNANFHLEEEIRKNYPDQVPFYEDDEAWIKRRQLENRKENHENDC